MRKQIRKIIYVIIFLILAGIAYIVFDDYSTKNINDSSITYLLNTRSKKVHSKDCGVGKRAKEKNKQLKTDSLTNIVEAGYTICGDCNAGIRKSFLANFMGSFDDKINVDYDDIVLPTKEEYLQAVEEVGEWYVNHIPTYCKKLQEEEIKDYTGDDKNVDSIKLKSKGSLFNKTYKYITTKETSTTIEMLNADDKILRANENAIKNYNSSYSNINVKGGILQYPCEYIETSSDYNKAGDDCVRYVFTVLNSIDPQFVERIAKAYEKSWSKINTSAFNGDDKKFFKAMTNNGFQIYDTNKIIDEEFIKEINCDFKLERGDIICREGHIHIYIGIEGTDNFGWGKVNRFYPANYKFSIEENSREYRIKMDKGNVEEYYTRVYRYKGGANE